MSLTSKNNEKIGAVNRGTPCESGLCNFCRTDCQGRCETWLSSLLGRRTLVPRDYGNATIGTENTTHVGVSYNALRIRGRVFGGAGLDPEKARTGDAAYCDADLTTAVGSNAKYPCDYPFLIGALSRNPVVDKYWDSFAVGAALCGIPLVIGENVGGGDNKTEFNPDGSIRALPDLDIVLQENRHADRRDQRHKPRPAAQWAIRHALHGKAIAAGDDHRDDQRRAQHQRQRITGLRTDRGQRHEPHVGADHVDLAVGKVDHADDAVDHRVADGDQRIDRTQRQAIDQLLGELWKKFVHAGTLWIEKSDVQCCAAVMWRLTHIEPIPKRPAGRIGSGAFRQDGAGFSWRQSWWRPCATCRRQT